MTRIDGLLDYENCYGSGPTDALEWHTSCTWRPAGLVRCTQLLGQQQGNKSHGLAELRDSLARARAALTTAGS